jgi:putative PIN family toxin of toxin-antitoxin system
VVLDTNVIGSGTIVPSGAPAAILNAWQQGRFVLLTSPEQLAELERALRRPTFARKYGIDELAVAALIGLLRRDGHIVTPPERTTIAVRDPDDERIVMIGVAGGAKYLVTGDEDPLSIASDPHLAGMQIVTVRAFRRFLEHGA